MSRTYKELMQSMVHGHKFKTTDKICEECLIPTNSFYKITNPNKVGSNGQPFTTPLEWVVPLTNATGNYALIEQICKDGGGLFIPPEKVNALKEKGEGVIGLLEDLLKIIK